MSEKPLKINRYELCQYCEGNSVVIHRKAALVFGCNESAIVLDCISLVCGADILDFCRTLIKLTLFTGYVNLVLRTK